MTSLSEIYAAILSAVQAQNTVTNNISLPVVPKGYVTVTTSSGATVFVPYYTKAPL